MLSTPWVHNSAGPAKDTVTCPGTAPTAGARADKNNFGEGKGAYEWEQGQPRRDVQGSWKGERSELLWSRQGVPERRRKVWREGPPRGKCYTCDGISHEIAPKVEEKEDSGHWKPGRLGKSRHWQNTYVFCHRYERHHPRTASAARTEEEVHDVCGHESQLQGWTSTDRR